MNSPTYISGNLQTSAYRILREYVYRILSQRGLTPISWSLLGLIAEAHNGIRQVEIADSLRIKPPQVTLLVRELERQGVIVATKSQFDGRAKLLVLTPKGKRLVRNTEMEVAGELKVLLDGVTESDMLVYQKVLKAIIANDQLIRSTTW